MPYPRTQSRRSVRTHDDAPDTDAAFRRIAALPDGPERSVLREEVVCAWMPMAVRLARRFRHRGETFDDLEQVAQLGLVKAVFRFDPSLGTAFPSYAIPAILGEVKRHFRDSLWSNPLTETLGDMEPGFDRIVDREALRPLLRALPERERHILYMRFFCEMTQSRIALQLGISQMYVSRLIIRTCARLRHQMMADTHDQRTAS
ncbi:sigma-70 family RNA polymerase sigma factor [Streptomyces hokutonensis]|uniref:Sigma-70 family RNA polymerase sigma factor n=1 Tax=Streptomyces hokutonensis TaxID=1306990 RepID=A0ABW6MB98_9ACTN